MPTSDFDQRNPDQGSSYRAEASPTLQTRQSAHLYTRNRPPLHSLQTSSIRNPSQRTQRSLAPTPRPYLRRRRRRRRRPPPPPQGWPCHTSPWRPAATQPSQPRRQHGRSVCRVLCSSRLLRRASWVCCGARDHQGPRWTFGLVGRIIKRPWDVPSGSRQSLGGVGESLCPSCIFAVFSACACALSLCLCPCFVALGSGEELAYWGVIGALIVLS